MAATLEDMGMKMPHPQVDLDAIRKQYHAAAEEEGKGEKRHKQWRSLAAVFVRAGF